MTNEDRAVRALCAITGYSGDSDTETNAVDLLADLMHVCDAGVLPPWGQILRTATMHFEEEGGETDSDTEETVVWPDGSEMVKKRIELLEMERDAWRAEARAAVDKAGDGDRRVRTVMAAKIGELVLERENLLRELGRGK